MWICIPVHINVVETHKSLLMNDVHAECSGSMKISWHDKMMAQYNYVCEEYFVYSAIFGGI